MMDRFFVHINGCAKVQVFEKVFFEGTDTLDPERSHLKDEQNFKQV